VPHVQCQEVTALLDTGYEGTATLRNVGKCVTNDECHIPEDLNRHKNPTMTRIGRKTQRPVLRLFDLLYCGTKFSTARSAFRQH